MLKHNKQIFAAESNHSNQMNKDNKEKMFNCNLKIMDNILTNMSDKEICSNQDDDDDDDKDSVFNNKQIKIKSNKHIDYVTKLDQMATKFKNYNDDIVDDQLDDEFNDDERHTELVRAKKNDYLQMALHYKNLCKSYKKQLIESHKTIRELHLTLEALERKNWIQKQQKSNMQLMRFESEENMKLTIEKCRVYCEKINRLTNLAEDDLAHNNETTEEMILSTLRNTFQEKKEIKSFSKSFQALINYINPTSKEIDSVKRIHQMNFSNLKNIINETLDYIKENSPRTYHCKCNGAFEFDKQLLPPNKMQTIKYIDNKKELCLLPAASPSSSSSSSCSMSSSSSFNYNHSNSSDYYKHQPSVEFLYKCVNLVQDLFDVDCFQNIPTKLNDVYYKLGQLMNFKKAIQNVFDPNENYTIEKLVCAVQTIHNQLNDQISSNLSHLLHSTNLQKVVDKFNMYDEYFPLFRELLDQIMKCLEISRLDQIMPSIRALKILATPTLS